MNEERLLPEPDRYAVCAYEGIPIKEFYQGVFDEVFLIFHPFFKPKTMDIDLFKPSSYPSNNEIIEDCEIISWEKFLKLSGIRSFKQLDIGLQTGILRLKEEYQDKKTVQLIENTCIKEGIIEPVEGLFPPLVMNKLLKSIKRLGYNWMWIGDEFGTERKLEYIDDFVSHSDMLNKGKNLFTHNHNILITTHWDRHLSLLCSDKKTVEYLVESCSLEGFYCNKSTQINWSMQ